MGYPTKIQLISRKKGKQWYVNFPNALAEAMEFAKGETVEWTVLSTTCLQMKRGRRQTKARRLQAIATVEERKGHAIRCVLRTPIRGEAHVSSRDRRRA